MLSDAVESLLNEMGAGTLNESTIKGRLTHIYEQAKAQEAELEKAKAELKHADTRITELEVKLYKQKDEPQGGRIEEGAERILDYLFNQKMATPDFIAEKLGMEKGEAQHYCDILVTAKMIDWTGVTYYIQPDGRSYVMKYLRKK